MAEVSSQRTYLLDSTIWIHLARGRLPDRVVKRVAELVETGVVATNEVVTAEVLIGSRTEGEYAGNVEDFASHVQLRIGQSTWDYASRLGFGLLRSGRSGSLPDLLIAATALQYGAVLVHADRGLGDIAQTANIPAESYLDEVRL